MLLRIFARITLEIFNLNLTKTLRDIHNSWRVWFTAVPLEHFCEFWQWRIPFFGSKIKLHKAAGLYTACAVYTECTVNSDNVHCTQESSLSFKGHCTVYWICALQKSRTYKKLHICLRLGRLYSVAP